MRRSTPKWAPAVVLASTLLCAACASAPSSTSSAPSANRSAEEFEELYLARLDSARMRYTDADVRFMTRMIHHHAQAIQMAELVPERTTSPQLRTLAARIINAQTDEIALMRRWLEDREQPVPHLAAGGGGGGHDFMTSAHPHETGMPGMLTPEELRRVEEARGAEFDRLFLRGMIRHHQGAVTMVKELFATDGAAQGEETFRFASDAQVDQATEIARMEAMLAEISAAGVPR